MQLYVGNATKQIFDFMYRVPETTGVRTQRIGIGTQIKVSGSNGTELNQKQVDSIVAQHEKYGMVRVSEIDRTKSFTGLCWDEKPISVSKLMTAIEHNTKVLIERGKKIREDTAVSGAAVLENSLLESGRPEALRETDVSFVEQNHDDTSPAAPISEGVIVKREDSAPPRQSGRRAAARRRA